MNGYAMQKTLASPKRTIPGGSRGNNTTTTTTTTAATTPSSSPSFDTLFRLSASAKEQTPDNEDYQPQQRQRRHQYHYRSNSMNGTYHNSNGSNNNNNNNNSMNNNNINNNMNNNINNSNINNNNNNSSSSSNSNLYTCKKRTGDNQNQYSLSSSSLILNHNNNNRHYTNTSDHSHSHNKNDMIIMNNNDMEDKNLESYPFLTKLKHSIDHDNTFRKEPGTMYLVEMVKSSEVLGPNNNNNHHSIEKNMLIYDNENKNIIKDRNDHGGYKKDININIDIINDSDDNNNNNNDYDDDDIDSEKKKLLNETHNIHKPVNAFTYTAATTTTTTTNGTSTTTTTSTTIVASSYPVSIMNRYDRMMSTRIHTLECGLFDYIFIPGAFVFGSKFMFVTILFSIVLVKISGFLFTGICCAITVSITQFSKKYTQRLRPDPIHIQRKRFDFRTKLTNFSFPSGDTAQAAAYGSSLYLLTNNEIYLILIPICAWSRIYFGCHFIGDCVVGAMIGILVTMFLWAALPLESLTLTEHKIVHFILSIITR